MKKLMLALFIILISSTFAAADLLDGLVFSMSFDEGTGTEAMDGSANGFTGTVNGNAQWVEGKFGMALEFNASADHVAIADNDAFHIEDEITQAAWVKLNRLPGAHAVIFGTRAGGGARHIGFGYGMNPPQMASRFGPTVLTVGSKISTILLPNLKSINGTMYHIPTPRKTAAK